MIIFLDANIIIYQVKAVAPFQQQVHEILQELVSRQPGATFAVSRLSLLECLVKPVREQDVHAIDRYRAFFTATDLRIVEITPQVVETAILLRARHALRTPDALQAASALSLNAPFLFLTGDRSLSSIPDLNVRLI